MIGSSSNYRRLDDYVTVKQSVRKPARNEYVIQPQMRIPNRKAVPLVRRMKQPISVDVFRVLHELNCFALNISPAQPNERSNPGWHATNIQYLSRRKRVEVSNQNMNTLLISFDALQ